MSLRRESLQALYMQLAEHLEREIVAGRHPPLARLPSEQQLMAMHEVSRVTVRQAIGQLVSKKLVEVKQGKGVFVVGPVVQHGLDSLTGFYDSLIEQGHRPTTRLLSFGPAGAAERSATVFEDAANGVPMSLSRLYLLRGKPFAVAHGLLPPYAARVTRAQANTHTIYGILRDLLGVEVARADIGIRARAVPQWIREPLKLRSGQPVLVMERVSRAPSGEPVEHSFFYIVPETYEFRLGVRGPLQISSAIKEYGARGLAGGEAGRPEGTAIRHHGRARSRRQERGMA